VPRTAFLALGLGLAVTTDVSSAAALPQVRVEGGRLWVRADRQPVSDVLGTVSAKTGVFFDVDGPLAEGTMTLVLEGVELERGIRSLVETLPGAAGHSMSYASDRSPARLIGVRVYAPGAPRPPLAPEPTAPRVMAAAPEPTATPGATERVERMVAAGVPRDAAESVQDLAREVQRMQTQPGSYRAEDLTPASREHLAGLLERGVSVERAVQMLLLQERYHQTLDDLRRSQAGSDDR